MSKKIDEESLWWKEDADRINALASTAKKIGIAVPISTELPDEKQGDLKDED